MEIGRDELFGRIVAIEALVTELLYEGLKDEARQVKVAALLQACEDHLHRQIVAAGPDGKRVAQHALQSLRDIVATLMTNFAGAAGDGRPQ